MAHADTDRYRENWQAEIDSIAIYRAMAEGEANRDLATVYRSLADVEERHADFWEQRLREAGAAVPPRRPGWRARVLAAVAHRLGAGSVLPTVTADEHTNQRMYDTQPETEGTGLRADERSHARLLATISGPSTRGLAGEDIARFEGRHRAIGGNTLRAAVLGANDGLVSNLALVMGVAGAGLAQRSIVITGLAGLVAGAGSMAMGEWISVQSSREQAERQLRVEAAELSAFPREEVEELRLIYQAKGLPEPEARSLAERLVTRDDAALDVLATEELGIDPQDLGGSPWTAAGASFLLFAVGAIVPLLPFLLLGARLAVAASIVASGVALLALGIAITVFTGRSAWRSGLRQLVIGLAAAALTYGVGALVGVSISG